MELTNIRGRIDALDNQMLELFCERMRLAAEAGAAKYRLGLPLSDDVREREIIAWAARVAGKDLAPYTRQFCEALFSIAKEYQVYHGAAYDQAKKSGK